MSKKILFIANHSSHGGSLKMFTWLANSLSRYYDVTYCNLSSIKPFYELENTVKYMQMNMKQKNSFIARNTVGFAKNVRDICRVVKNGKIDLVVNFADHALYPLLVAKKIDGFKVLLSQRVDPYSCKKRTDLFRMKLYKYCDALVCQTESAQEYFCKDVYKNLKKTVIENPALGKTTVKWNEFNNEGYILSLARIDLEQKRQDVLVTAMQIVHREYPDIKVKLYGKDVHNSLDKVMALVEKLDLSQCVQYCGVTDDSYDILSKARMMVLTSDYEGIPNAIIEAMEVGVPVISTDCKPGGAKLLIDSDEKGKVVECGNPDALAEAIKYYIKNPEIAAQCAEKAYKSLDRFSEKTITIKWINFIDLLFA